MAWCLPSPFYVNGLGGERGFTELIKWGSALTAWSEVACLCADGDCSGDGSNLSVCVGCMQSTVSRLCAMTATLRWTVTPRNKPSVLSLCPETVHSQVD